MGGRHISSSRERGQARDGWYAELCAVTGCCVVVVVGQHSSGVCTVVWTETAAVDVAETTDLRAASWTARIDDNCRVSTTTVAM